MFRRFGSGQREAIEGGEAAEDVTVFGGGQFLDGDQGRQHGLREGSGALEEEVNGFVEVRIFRAEGGGGQIRESGAQFVLESGKELVLELRLDLAEKDRGLKAQGRQGRSRGSRSCGFRGSRGRGRMEVGGWRNWDFRLIEIFDFGFRLDDRGFRFWLSVEFVWLG